MGERSERARLIARLDPATPLREGVPLRLALDAEALHRFAGETGQRLPCATGQAPGPT
ncbi:MAG: hypothetical protein ACM3ST_07335 [Bdellovibrio bacteriovorus]